MPLLPDFDEEPILSIQVRQLKGFPPIIMPKEGSNCRSIWNPLLFIFISI
jgi:hypothetical protein